MNNERLPDQLKEIEQGLVRRVHLPISNDLRERVLLAVERAREAAAQPSYPVTSRWDYPAAAAAITMALLNLGVIAASVTDFVPPAEVNLKQSSSDRKAEIGWTARRAPKFSDTFTPGRQP
jgi:hypothetical protein